MRSPQEIIREQIATTTIVKLTSAFEGIASIRVAQTKNQVLQAEKFFSELWSLYTKLRVDDQFRFGREEHEVHYNKDLYIIITAEGGFSGDIDQRLITFMLSQYDPNKHDIIVIGHHGAVQLAQAGVSFKKYFKLPSKDENINVEPLIKYVRQYANTVVYYQTYVSLMVQDIKRIELNVAVLQEGKNSIPLDELISEQTYIFEPSNYAVIIHLERSMLQIALSQLILDSKLAQYASRFRAMTIAYERANDKSKELNTTYYRTKRAISDERSREILVGIKMMETI